MLNKFIQKHKKALKVFFITIMFIYNLIFSLFIFCWITLGELITYSYNYLGLNAVGGPLQSTFSTPEIWGWYVIVSSIVFFILFLSYVILGIKKIKENGITKKHCKCSFAFSIVYTLLQLLPLLICNRF